MRRHQYMIDLLRTDFVFSETVEQLLNKRELTDEDFDMIIKNAETVVLAAVAAKRIKKTSK
jgi:hypothetical protein